MIEAVVVCEGQTEESFVRDLLARDLGRRNIFLQARLIPTSSGAKDKDKDRASGTKGGALTGQRVRRFLRNTLREQRKRSSVYVTTFFDLYGLPADFPGVREAETHTDMADRAEAIERTLHAEAVRLAECRPERFFPHIQPCEFEALLFSDTARFADVEPKWKRAVARLEAARRAAGGPERVNDGPNTHPSARLENVLRPRYDKIRDGLAVAARIGVDRMRAECPRFDRWIAHMESLAAAGAPMCRL